MVSLKFEVCTLSLTSVSKDTYMIAVIDYNAGNIQSVEFALERLGAEYITTNDKATIKAADKVIFPGVGEAKNTMEFLKAQGLDVFIKDLKQPVLGVCLGMQLMCQHSEEGDVDALGIFDTTVKLFKPENGEKVPHMGWNTITDLKGPLFSEELEGRYVYFVHSYYVAFCDETIATTTYGLPYSSALHKDNFYATQFHPEKSGDVGELILKNFINL